MKRSPLLNATFALAYIAGVSLFMQFIQSVRQNNPDAIFDGMGFISLFVFSAAVMAFLFFYQPMQLLIENKKSEALTYFLKTLGIFGVITITLITIVSLQ